MQLRASRVCSAGGCAWLPGLFPCLPGRKDKEGTTASFSPQQAPASAAVAAEAVPGPHPVCSPVPSEQRTRHLTEPPLPARPPRLPPASGTEERTANPPLRRPRPERGLSPGAQALAAPGTAAIACHPAQEVSGAHRGPQRALHLASAPSAPVPGPGPPPVPR